MSQKHARSEPENYTRSVTSIVALQDEEEAKILDGIFPTEDIWLTKKKTGRRFHFNS